MADGKRIAALALAGALQGFQQGKERQRDQDKELRTEAREDERFEFAKRKFELEMKKLGLEVENFQIEKDLFLARGGVEGEATRAEEALKADVAQRAADLQATLARTESSKASAAESTARAAALGKEKVEPTDFKAAAGVLEDRMRDLQSRLEQGNLKGEAKQRVEQELLLTQEQLRQIRQEALTQLGVAPQLEGVSEAVNAPAAPEVAAVQGPGAPATPLSQETTATGLLGNLGGRGIGVGLKGLGGLLQEALKRNSLSDIGRRTAAEVEQRKIAPPFIRPSGSF